MFKVCPDYLASGLMEMTGKSKYGREGYYFVDEDRLDSMLSYETRELLALCQQIFDQVDTDYNFPHFIRKEQYEILCKIVAERIQSETGVPTTAEFYWET